MEVAEDRDPGGCGQRAATSVLGFDRGASEEKQRSERSDQDHGSDRNSHLDRNFEDCRMGVVPYPPTIKIIGSERGKQTCESTKSSSQKRPLLDGFHAKPVDGPSRVIEQALASNSADSAE